jgi:pSer/pThr/pTyr-binding forkhead associated (FHA) protein
VVLIVDEGGQRIAVPDKREALIGRRGRANGSFPDIDLTVHKGEACGVSREHARLLLRDGQVALEDLGAPNCTWVGDKQLIPGTPHPLRNGERLRFGTLAATIQFP